MIVLLYGLRLLPAPHFNTTLIIPLFVVLVHQVLWLTSRELFFSFQLNYLTPACMKNELPFASVFFLHS